MDNVVPRCRGVVIDIGLVAGLVSAVGSTAASSIPGRISGFGIRLASGSTISLLARCAVAVFSTRVNRVGFAIRGFAAGRILGSAFIRASIFTNSLIASLITGRVTGKTGFIRAGFGRCFCPGLKTAIGVFLFGLAL